MSRFTDLAQQRRQSPDRPPSRFRSTAQQRQQLDVAEPDLFVKQSALSQLEQPKSPEMKQQIGFFRSLFASAEQLREAEFTPAARARVSFARGIAGIPGIGRVFGQETREALLAPKFEAQRLPELGAEIAGGVVGITPAFQIAGPAATAAAGPTTLGLTRALPFLARGRIAQQAVRTGTAGALTFGGVEAILPGEDRIGRTLRALPLGFGFGVGGLAIQKGLSRFQQIKLNRQLATAQTVLERAQGQVETGVPGAIGKAQHILRGVNQQQRHIAVNVIRQLRGQPAIQPRSLYERTIGQPMWDFLTRQIPKLFPEPLRNAVGKRLIFGFGKPPAFVEAQSRLLIDFGLNRTQAREVATILSEGLSSGERQRLLQILKGSLPGGSTPEAVQQTLRAGIRQRKTPQELLDSIRGQLNVGANPSLNERAAVVREVIDDYSQKMIAELPLAEQTKEVVRDNLGSYVRRYFRTKEGSGLFAFFRGRRRTRLGLKEFKEKAKPVKEEFREMIQSRLTDVEREFESLSSLENVFGIGRVEAARLQNLGIRNVDTLAAQNAESLSRRFFAQENLRLGREIDDIVVRFAKKPVADRPLGEAVSSANAQSQVDRLLSQIQVLEERAQNMISEASAFASRRRGLTGRRTELARLLEKPPKPLDFPEEVKRELGEVRDAAEAAARTVNLMSNEIAVNRFLDKIALNPRWSSANPRPGFVQLPDSPRLGRLRKKFVTPEIAEDINGITAIPEDAERLSRAMIGAWKFGKVVANPATHFRNIMSNSILLDASGVPIPQQAALLSGAMDDIIKRTPLFRDAQRTGLLESEFVSAEIDAMLRPLQQSVRQGGRLGEMAEFAGKVASDARLSNLGRIYQLEEQVYKLAKFRQLRGLGFNAESATQEAERWIFNYAKIPDFIRRVRSGRQRIGGVPGTELLAFSPFITFQFKAIPRVAESFIRNPFRLGKYLLLKEAVEEYAIHRFNLTDEQVQLIKSDRRVGPLDPILPFKDESGSFRVMRLAYILPYGSFGELMNLSTFLGNPLLTLTAGVVSNVDPFRSRTTEEPELARIVQEGATISQRLRALSGFAAEIALPPLLGQGRRALEQVTRGKPRTAFAPSPDAKLEVIGTLFGLRTSAVDPLRRQQQINREANEASREFKEAIRRIGRRLDLTTPERADLIRQEQLRFENRLQKLQVR